MRRLAATLLVLALAAPLPAGDGPRIGYVDMQRLFEQAPQVVASKDRLDRELRPRNDAIVADEARLRQMEQALTTGGDLDDEERLATEREIRNLLRSIERRREDLREELHFRRNAEVKALEEEFNLAVQSVAREHGYDLVLPGPVIYASREVDITDLILDALSADHTDNADGR